MKTKDFQKWESLDNSLTAIGHLQHISFVISKDNYNLATELLEM